MYHTRAASTVFPHSSVNRVGPLDEVPRLPRILLLPLSGLHQVRRASVRALAVPLAPTHDHPSRTIEHACFGLAAHSWPTSPLRNDSLLVVCHLSPHVCPKKMLARGTQEELPIDALFATFPASSLAFILLFLQFNVD